MARELKRLERSPPPGISAWPAAGSISQLEAQLQGPPDSPYEAGLFRLRVAVPERCAACSSPCSTCCKHKPARLLLLCRPTAHTARTCCNRSQPPATLRPPNPRLLHTAAACRPRQVPF